MNNDRPTILVIDNDEGLVAAISARLEHYGYNCVTAATGAQGVTTCSDQEIDLVITDLNMPMGNGVELAKTLRETSEVPIVVITGYRHEFRRELRAIRNVTVVEKPFDPQQLLELIETELVMAGHNLP